MARVSVIIPTLWRSCHTKSLLRHLKNWGEVLEIIIIDNNPSARPAIPELLGCTILEQAENIYVNPAWNLGVQQASGELIMLCNDDIFFETSVLDHVVNELKSNEIIGLHPNSFMAEAVTNSPQLSDTPEVGNGWGCLLLLKKSAYISIPKSIKIWFGDDWLFHTISSKRAMTIHIKGTVSATSNDTEFNNLKAMDLQNFQHAINHWLLRPLRILSRMGFSGPLKFALNLIQA